MTRINIKEIIIPDSFKNSKPNDQKVEMKRQYYNKNRQIQKPLLVDENNVLLDGYIWYLLLLENGFDGYVGVDVVKKPRVSQSYVWARHPGNPKIYVWKCPSNAKYYRGDIILVETSKGPSAVVVENYGVLYYPPIDRKIRNVIT